MPETIIDSVLKGHVTREVLLKWLNDETIEDTLEYCPLLCCSRSEFVAFFLYFLRDQTDSILRTNSNALNLMQQQNTPEKILNSKRKHKRSVSEPTSEQEKDKTDNLSVRNDRHRSHESPSRDKSNSKKPGRRVKTKLFNDGNKDTSQSISLSSPKTDSDDSRISSGLDRLVLSSTPMKNGVNPPDFSNLPLTSPVTPHSRSFGNYERCDTPRTGYRFCKSQEKSSLGDFMVNPQPSKSNKKKRATPKNTSTEAETEKCSLDLSNSEMFPVIGSRKSSSLRSEKRRIKPTNIDSNTPQKSYSLNSFNTDIFQQPSVMALEDNVAFKIEKLQPKESSNTFEAERSILKQERHKLMEKFNILNPPSTPKTPTPHIKITCKDSVENHQNFVKADLSKVIFKEQIDLLIDIYEILLRNNLILSVNNEMYFLISVLLSQQYEEDYAKAESQINENTSECILKTIHNSSYFAVKSLWHQRQILEFMLDKNSLKFLGENKKVRSFYPDLAKFLLNLYGIKTELENSKEDKSLHNRYSNGMVCFNFETDNADNFPSLLSFQNFKKQRDMFYEILRWYTENQQSGAAKSTFRTRVKTLLSLAISPANHSHLARLYTAHMLAECIPNSQQESKLSKLQRRLTGPASHESHRLPRFTTKEMFYKEFLIFAENESFRVHLRDSLASEICSLNSSTIVHNEDRNNSITDVSKEYLQLLNKLRLLSKFLGFLTSLPYTQIPVEFAIKTGSVNCVNQNVHLIPPKEKVLENHIALRNYSQPTIDLKNILTVANENSRLCITIPWLVQYLSMLDYSSLRTQYYHELLRNLFDIYVQKLRITNENTMKKNSIIFLQLTLGSLFDLPHFPQDYFYEKAPNELKMAASISSDESLDSLDLIEESILFEVCPFLKDINVLLFTSRPAQDSKDIGSFRHITPVTMSLNPEDRIRNKEKEIQARLEEEFLKAQPSSTRRVLELVVDRVTSSCLKHLSVHLREARKQCRRDIALALQAGDPNPTSIYSRNLTRLRQTALQAVSGMASERSVAALKALLAAGTNWRPLKALATRAVVGRLRKWIDDNWASAEVLCKDIEGELKNLQVLGNSALNDDVPKAPPTAAMTLPAHQFEAISVSPSAVIIDIKEQICLLLEGSPVPSISHTLHRCLSVCRRDNVFARPPAQRAIAQLTTDCLIVYVSRKPEEINEEFLNLFHTVWNECCPERKRHDPPELEPPERREDISPVLRNFESEESIPTPTSDDETDTKCSNSGDTVIKGPIVVLNSEKAIVIKSETADIPSDAASIPSDKSVSNLETTKVEDSLDFIEYFERVLCPRNIMILSDSKCKASDVWVAMATVLVFMLKNDYLSEDSLTEQCLAVYRQDWPQNILENLSTCMKLVCSQWPRSNTGKFTLFLDFLAEFCVDMDFESFD